MCLCGICRRRVCPPACPNHRAEYTEYCNICGCGILRGESFYRLAGGVTVCASCAEELSVYGFAAKCREAGLAVVTDALGMTEEVA